MYVDVPLAPVGLHGEHSANEPNNVSLADHSACVPCSVITREHLATEPDKDPAIDIVCKDASQLGAEGFVY